ncbi:hypothetical protein PENCOP_c009G03794 [Penicillium coprophilum]|uniref:Protein kinase domain-containing protein n=1 Tax=Penicillium coprophilum TaxID=36646 RepID=A0A1V6UIP9_9EURO|nr:hypothetical protein PENCOP_c009G03794 [Penicillium coprophilum]
MAVPSQMQTRIHTPGLRQLDVRYVKLDPLGSGQFGIVYKAFNVNTGRFLAVTVISQLKQDAGRKEMWYRALKREVETLSELKHVQETFSAVAPKLTIFSETARLNPAKRASAVQMLIKYFGGEGFSTPRNPPLSRTKLKIRTEAELHYDPMELDDRSFKGIQEVPKRSSNPTPVCKLSRLQARVLG